MSNNIQIASSERKSNTTGNKHDFLWEKLFEWVVVEARHENELVYSIRAKQNSRTVTIV